jgi:hypothetical protein
VSDDIGVSDGAISSEEVAELAIGRGVREAANIYDAFTHDRSIYSVK